MSDWRTAAAISRNKLSLPHEDGTAIFRAVQSFFPSIQSFGLRRIRIARSSTLPNKDDGSAWRSLFFSEYGIPFSLSTCSSLRKTNRLRAITTILASDISPSISLFVF